MVEDNRGSVSASPALDRELLDAKFSPPPPRPGLASRRALVERAVDSGARVVAVTAPAGYGKTTLLADFARRTRLRTIWYRLDDDDLDWTSIIHHLVAAGREHDPSFAPATLSMLGETSLSAYGMSKAAVIQLIEGAVLLAAVVLARQERKQ